MRVAALYDIHGNLPALEAVLARIAREGVDRLVVGGDVLPGPMPRETLARLLDLGMPVHFIRGNAEREVLELREGIEPEGLPPSVMEELRWVAAELTPEEIEVLASWPRTTRMDIDGVGRVSFCHATPESDREAFTRRTPETALLPVFERVDADLVVCGHTHMQFDRRIGPVRVVNAGSVGMPFGEPGAYWLMLGPGIDLRRTAYDLDHAADRIRSTECPRAWEIAENEVLRPPSEEEALEVFERAEEEEA